MTQLRTKSTELQFTKVSYALGARVTGIDLREPLDAETVATLRAAWLDNLLLCFPDQDLDEHHFLTFAEQFGELETIRAENRDPNFPNLGYVTNRPVKGEWDGHKGGVVWHADENFTLRPTSATLLLAKELPPVGGDTMFANQYLAYEALSPGMQDLIAPLKSVQQVLPSRRNLSRPLSDRAAIQPVVRVHPETGRKALNVGARCRQFIGMSAEESRPLISYLNDHAVRDEFTYRHRWSKNDLVMWDNRALLHIALRDYDQQHESRHLFRTACVGEPSGEPYTGEDVDNAFPVGEM